MMKSLSKSLSVLIALVTLSAAGESSRDLCLQLAATVKARGGQLTSPIPSEWTKSQFSNPKKHNPKNFDYVVHVIESDHELENVDPNFGNYFTHTFASVISNDVLSTYENGSGIILEVEPDNFVSNACYDTRFEFSSSNAPDSFEKYRQEHPPITIAEMLAGTLWSKFMSKAESGQRPQLMTLTRYYQENEVLLKGRGDNGHVLKIIGVFINNLDTYTKEFEGGEKPRAEAAKAFAKKFRLPIITIN